MQYEPINPNVGGSSLSTLHTREEILAEINEVFTNVVANPKVKARAQADIQQMISGALEDLDSQPTKLNGATIKVLTAKQRYQQASNQNTRLPIALAIWMVLSLAGAALVILLKSLWPSTGTMPTSDIVIGATLWGIAGASIDGLRELHTRSAAQQFEPSRMLWYWAHPIIGGGLGAIVFLVVIAGLLTTGQNQVLASGGGGFNATLPYLLAALVGFEEETVIRYLRRSVRQIFQVSTTVSEDEGG